MYNNYYISFFSEVQNNRIQSIEYEQVKGCFKLAKM